MASVVPPWADIATGERHTPSWSWVVGGKPLWPEAILNASQRGPACEHQNKFPQLGERAPLTSGGRKSEIKVWAGLEAEAVCVTPLSQLPVAPPLLPASVVTLPSLLHVCGSKSPSHFT